MQNKNTKNHIRKTSSPGAIRIISGKWRGSKLPVIDSGGLRPTTDRVKETLFNWLIPIIRDARCLDCYAGSGALGFEALSRGAASVTFLEKNHAVYKQLVHTASVLNAKDATVIETDSLIYLSSRASDPFNVVFLDPPYNKNLISTTLARLEENNWLADESWIYIETEQDCAIPSIPRNWVIFREKQTRHISYRLFHRTPPTQAPL